MTVFSKSETLFFEGKPVETASSFLVKYIQSKINSSEFIAQTKFSSNRRVIAFLIYKKENEGANYSSILIIQTNNDQSRVFDESRYLSSELLNNQSNGMQSVDEIEEIDDKAQKIVLKMNVKSAKFAPYTVDHELQLREIPSGRILNDQSGLNQTR